MSNLLKIAKSLRLLIEELDEDSEDLTEADLIDSDSWNFNIEHDSPTDPTESDVGYRGPHTMWIDRKPVRFTLYNTKPHRAVKR